MNRWLVALVAAGLMLALPMSGTRAWAQADQVQGERKAKKQRAPVQQPDLDDEDQLAPRQFDQRFPSGPIGQQQPPRRSAPQGEPDQPGGATTATPPHAESTRGDGPRLMASVLFPNDPKRRLEVLWQNEAARSDTHLIVINGQSTWSAPKGLRLGVALAALEKLNRKPFKIAGFDQPNPGSVSDWQGGALETLPGGCRLGIRLVPD